jgi:spore coat protein A
VLDVVAERYRLRILNASNARRYRLAWRSGPPFVQIGSDGGLLARPISHTELVISPGERFDVVVDFSDYPPGTELTVLNGLGTGSTGQIMRMRVTGRASDYSIVPTTLSDVRPLDPVDAVRTRVWRFGRGKGDDRHRWLINDAPFDPERMDADPRLGEIEIWRFITDLHHPVHLHLDPFQVVARRGRNPGPYDAGWKDTIDIGPVDNVDVAVRFTDYTGRYLLHCHNLEHEDMAMMAGFETT